MTGIWTAYWDAVLLYCFISSKPSLVFLQHLCMASHSTAVIDNPPRRGLQEQPQGGPRAREPDGPKKLGISCNFELSRQSRRGVWRCPCSSRIMMAPAVVRLIGMGSWLLGQKKLLPSSKALPIHIPYNYIRLFTLLSHKTAFGMLLRKY